MPLNTQPNVHTPGVSPWRDFTPGDDFYEALIDAHRDLSPHDSARLNARLILLLANHIGDLQIIRTAIEHARSGLVVGDSAGSTSASSHPPSV